MLTSTTLHYTTISQVIMDIFVQRTYGTYIETKGNALIWQFSEADPEFGYLQSKVRYGVVCSVQYSVCKVYVQCYVVWCDEVWTTVPICFSSHSSLIATLYATHYPITGASGPPGRDHGPLPRGDHPGWRSQRRIHRGQTCGCQQRWVVVCMVQYAAV